MSGTICVIGESLLDIDVQTVARRLAPDGPAPVLEERSRSARPGGAALAAALLHRGRLANRVILLTPLADDPAGRQLRGLLGTGVWSGIEVLTPRHEGGTATKTRLRCDGTTVVRLDGGGGRIRNVHASPEMCAAVLGADAVLVADYGRGLLEDDRIRDVVRRAAVRRPVVWDPHPRGPDPVAGAALCTPNSAEAGARCGRTVGTDVRAAGSVAAELLHAWGCRAVAVTMGGSGAVLFDGSGVLVQPTSETAHGDTCGAGDCFSATAVAALADGALASEAVAAGTRAATQFVRGGGVGSIDQPFAPQREPVQDAAALVERIRARGGRVVATGGCFDLLHAGHVATLDAARSLGDALVVCVNSDASVRRLKGQDRPLQPIADRVRVLASLRSVDAVVVFDEDDPSAVLRRLRPDLWIKGGDYAGAELTEQKVLESWGGQCVTVPYLDGRSTSSIVELARR
jgi:D-beta-D-heptose 7-phosphate kinase / D-beta-D-heptose 1-phosphate adenosyltransferase